MQRTKYLVTGALFCALLAVSSFLSFPLPPFPGDVSLQTMIIYIMIIILPPSYSFISVFLYMLLGLAGLPVFSQGGGIMYVFNPTFGYILGFILAAYIGPSVFKSKKLESKPFTLKFVISTCISLILIFSSGVLYMHVILNFYLDKPQNLLISLLYGFVIFIPIELLKIVAAYPATILLRKLYNF